MQIVHLFCTKTNTVSKQIEARFHDTSHLGVPSGASKLISKHMVFSTQTVHLSCIKISNISKQTKSCFHLSPLTYEYHRVWPKWFLSLGCIRHKPCTYLLPKLTLSTNRPKPDFVWHTSSRSSIGCIQTDFWAYGTFHANRASYLVSRFARSPNRPNQTSTWAPLPRSTIGCVQSGFLAYGALGTNRTPILHRN